MPVVVGYWKIRGFAQSIRMLLNYVGVEFEDKYYECGPAPDYSRDSWLNEKYTLGITFPNLPYLIDGELKLSQTHTILRYLAKKHGLVAATDEEQRRADWMLEELVDVRRGWLQWCYGRDTSTAYFDTLPAKLKEFEEFLGNGQWFAGDTLTHTDFVVYEFLDHNRLKNADVLKDSPKLAAFMDRFESTAYFDTLPAKLKEFEEFLGNGQWFAGDTLTHTDFVVYEFLDHNRLKNADVLKDSPKLAAFMDRFEALPAMKQYMSSDRFLKWPLNNKMAQFGGNVE